MGHEDRHSLTGESIVDTWILLSVPIRPLLVACVAFWNRGDGIGFGQREEVRLGPVEVEAEFCRGIGRADTARRAAEERFAVPVIRVRARDAKG